MSFFGRVLSRAAVPGSAQLPLARPKSGSLLARQDSGEDDTQEEVQALQRQTEEAEEVQALRRQVEDEEDAQALRRQTEQNEDEEAQAQPLRRQPEDEEDAQALHRQTEQNEDEEARAQPLRRQPEDEEDAQALRRQSEPGKDEEAQAQPLRRVTPPAADSLEADNSPQPDDNPAEPAMQALRREAVLSPPAVGATAQAPVPAGPSATAALDTTGLQGPTAMEPYTPGPIAQDRFSHGPGQTQPAVERPRVTIDQIDVVIHEDAPAATGPASPTADLGRALKTKYLGGL